MVDDEIVITGRYPTNEEFTKLLDLPGRCVGSEEEVHQGKGF